MRNKGFFLTAVSAVVLLLLVILIHTNREMDQDLGRHIKLGEIIWQTRAVPKTNLFSYTNADFPFLNHHWGSEVIFYLTSQAFGIIGISYLKIILFAASVILILLTARKIASWETGLFSMALFLPLLIPRNLERPEMFGYFFFCLYLFLYIYQRGDPGLRRDDVKIRNNNTGKYATRTLYLIPLISFLWTNLHISFAYGFLLLALFIMDAVIRGERGKVKTLGLIFVASVAATLINPHGVAGLLYPLKIFQNYGYSIQENQNLFFLASVTSNIFLSYFWFLFFVLLTSFGIYLFSLVKDERPAARIREDFLFIALFAVFSALAMTAYRNLPLFVFTGIICSAYFLREGVGERFIQKRNTLLFLITTTVAAGFIFLIGTNYLYQLFDLNKKFEIGIKESYKEGVNFFLASNLPAPIFNNFDIGGYLDYRLYPKYRVFVDNRPEAYPVEFFEEYKSVQNGTDAISDLFKRHNIRTVIVSHTDATPWGVQFVRALPKLTDFKIVYLDPVVVIAVKNDQKIKALASADFEKAVAVENDYRDLMAYYYTLNSWEKSDLAAAALEKAYAVNPTSCTVRLQYGIYLIRSPHLPVRRRGSELLQSTGLCPYPPYIREGLKGRKLE